MTEADLAAVRAEMKQQAEAAMRRTEADEAAIARLHTMLDTERAARQQAVAAAQHDAAEAASAIAGAPLVRAGRFNLTLTGFTQVDVTAWNQLSEDQLNPGDRARRSTRRASSSAAPACAPSSTGWVVGGAVEFDGNTVNGAQARIIGAEASLQVAQPRDRMSPLPAAHPRPVQDARSASRCCRATAIACSSSARTSSAPCSPASTTSARGCSGGWRFLRYASRS